MSPDIIAMVRFKTTAEGGRKTDISGKFYACPLIIDDEAFDCRIMLSNSTLQLGKIHEVPIKFLLIEDVLPKLYIGKKFKLWEGKDIGEGEVLKISNMLTIRSL